VAVNEIADELVGRLGKLCRFEQGIHNLQRPVQLRRRRRLGR
jgi:hypothetical protein